jgi:hypothetical protein
MPLSLLDFDDIYLGAHAAFLKELQEYEVELLEPVAMLALAQQVRQLPAPVQAKLKQSAPQAWQRLFGDEL